MDLTPLLPYLNELLAAVLAAVVAWLNRGKIVSAYKTVTGGSKSVSAVDSRTTFDHFQTVRARLVAAGGCNEAVKALDEKVLPRIACLDDPQEPEA